MFQVISGGQTGVDQAALDVAIGLCIPYGGSIPKGRITEAGPLDEKYKMKELESSDYTVRTRQNVIDSDGTLILYEGDLTGGTLLTRKYAEELNKDYSLIDLQGADINEEDIVRWIFTKKIEILNVAGPRESKRPGIYQRSSVFLEKIFLRILNENNHSSA